MEQYKKNLAQRMKWGKVIVLIAVVLSVLTTFVFKPTENGASSLVLGFIQGLFIGVALVTFMVMLKANRASKAANSEEMIRRLYREEHDERKAFIREKSGFPLMTFGAAGITTIGALLAYYDMKVSVAVMASGLLMLLYQLILKLYFSRKY